MTENYCKDTSNEFTDNHRSDEFSVVTSAEAEVVTEYECCGYCEYAVEEFAFRVHVFEDVEHCDVVSKSCNKTCRTSCRP